MHEQTQITSKIMACDCVVDARSNEKVKGATKNRPNAYPTDASCKIHKKYENPSVNEYLRSNSVDDEVVEDMSAHAAAEQSNRWNTYTSKKVAENNLAVESNESDDAARGELATLASAAAPASESAIDPPSFVSGASKCTPSKFQNHVPQKEVDDRHRDSNNFRYNAISRVVRHEISRLRDHDDQPTDD